MHVSDTSFIRMIEGDGASAYLLRLFDTFRTTVHCTMDDCTYVVQHSAFSYLVRIVGYWICISSISGHCM